LRQVVAFKAHTGSYNRPPFWPQVSLPELLSTFWSNVTRKIVGGLAKTCLGNLIFVRIC
jgi:hypothetical protein